MEMESVVAEIQEEEKAQVAATAEVGPIAASEQPERTLLHSASETAPEGAEATKASISSGAATSLGSVTELLSTTIGEVGSETPARPWDAAAEAKTHYEVVPAVMDEKGNMRAQVVIEAYDEEGLQSLCTALAERQERGVVLKMYGEAMVLPVAQDEEMKVGWRLREGDVFRLETRLLSGEERNPKVLPLSANFVYARPIKKAELLAELGDKSLKTMKGLSSALAKWGMEPNFGHEPKDKIPDMVKIRPKISGPPEPVVPSEALEETAKAQIDVDCKQMLEVIGSQHIKTVGELREALSKRGIRILEPTKLKGGDPLPHTIRLKPIGKGGMELPARDDSEEDSNDANSAADNNGSHEEEGVDDDEKQRPDGASEDEEQQEEEQQQEVDEERAIATAATAAGKEVAAAALSQPAK